MASTISCCVSNFSRALTNRGMRRKRDEAAMLHLITDPECVPPDRIWSLSTAVLRKRFLYSGAASHRESTTAPRVAVLAFCGKRRICIRFFFSLKKTLSALFGGNLALCPQRSAVRVIRQQRGPSDARREGGKVTRGSAVRPSSRGIHMENALTIRA